MTAPANPGGRARAGYHVTRKYGVPHADIAFLLNIEEKTYLRRLRLSGFDPDAAIRSDRLPDMEGILANIRTELLRLTEGGKVPDKGAADALTSLARALKTVIELARESTPPPAMETAPATVTPEELREALARIDRRINELADSRAAEIIRRRLDGPDGDRADEGVVLRGT
ncbi:hypothetical protein [Phyllobacterium phragmitis]|uniref:Terminase small subunit n=1 Tax=Phyllobacterium phragmitis TaxID=2670329 RepID=A0ABQ0GXJ9_9HYPH